MTGQFGCISCDNLGDFYQEIEGQTSCAACALGTQRYLGVFDGAKPKLVPMQARSVSRICDSDLLGAWQRPSFAGYYSPEGKAGEVRALLAASRDFEC